LVSPTRAYDTRLADRFDVVVVGAGPAGSIAALVLARGGARVALVDKARFPRDKACGDLIGPRGVQLLADLGVVLPGSARVGDMVVVGPTGRRVRLPCAPGLTYPGYGLAVRRTALDASLRDAAVAAGAVPITGRVGDPLVGPDGVEGFALGNGQEVRGGAVVGADGATSAVAAAAGLVDRARALWGFAVRTYLGGPVPLPVIAFWEPEPWSAVPGYGWVFPGPDGQANAGIGVGTLGDRTKGKDAARLLPGFLRHLEGLGLLAGTSGPGGPGQSGAVLGGWLKMGMVGTRPASGRVLLVGDAAGLVNPLQGEGISQALRSGWAAATALLATGGEPRTAGARYRAWLRAEHLPYQRITAAMQALLLPRPRAVSAVGRVLTLGPVGRAVAPGWAVFWNELLDGAGMAPGRATAAAVTAVGKVLTARCAPPDDLYG
jgi:geranylgeranyl reductase family protein